MGCDIHTHIEVRLGDTWHHFASPELDRDYKLFAIIAGERLDTVMARERSDIRPVARLHELPDDITAVTRACLEEDELSGVHNKGVLTPEDLERLQEELYRLYPEQPRDGHGPLNLEHGIFRTYVNDGPLREHRGFDGLRVLFWFEG